MDKPLVINSENKTLALITFIAGIIMWFLLDSSKQLAHDLLKAIAFFLFGIGLINLSRWKPWSQLSAREKKMRLVFLAIIAILLIAAILVFFFWK